MRKLIQHNKDSLCRYTKVAGLTLSELLKKAGISKTEEQLMQSHQQEQAFFSYKQLNDLAKVLCIPTFYLVSNEVYETKNATFIDYRNEVDQLTTDYENYKFLSKYRKIREDYLFLLNEMGLSPQPFELSLSGNDSIEDAKKIRAFLGVENVTLMATHDYYDSWRHLIESKDIIVHETGGNLGSDGCALFYEVAPVIVILKSDQVHSRRLFTLLHELVHLGLRQTVIDGRVKDAVKDIEQYCNRVAGYALLPAELIAQFSTQNFSVAQRIKKLRKASGASFMATALQLLFSGEISQHEYDDWYATCDSSYVKSKPIDPEAPFGGQPKKNTVIPTYGKHYVQLVYQAFWSDKISFNSACNLLSIPTSKDAKNPVEVFNDIETKVFC